ncbi:MAG: hypothetical protein LBB62_07000 [Proteiniphilum sp.]|jgi:hypothetical protein|nr:hypothetical protein [Proteiniphilum sp.]
MWNRLSLIVLIAGFISCFEVFPQDSVVTTEERFLDFLSVSSGDLSQFQRDSIMDVIPKDTSSLTSLRHFNGNLAEQYAADDALNYERNINKSFLQRLKEVISALLDKFLGISDASAINNLSDKVLNIVLAAIFLTAVYIAVRLFMNHRGRWFFEKKNETVSVNLSNVEQHIHEADFEALLKEAEQGCDTRQSVRLLYLWLLKTFTDRDIIQWNPDKTNIDYLFEIRDKALQKQFGYLSYLYSYIWYGGFSINDSEYGNARGTFLRHIKMKPENE